MVQCVSIDLLFSRRIFTLPENFGSIMKAVFDILSLALILFLIYRFAIKRRAFKLAIGVGLFFLVLLIVDAANLTALGFVFGDFRQLGVIAILIIFQPELRSALEKIGGSTFEGIQNINLNHLGDKDSEIVNSHEVIEAVSRSAQDLANIKYGALIVIERNDSISEYKKSGTALDAIVNANTLSSIFYKGGALHDGAVIIHNGRIDVAGCVLPMTARVDIPQELGTRHRAAIGTTELFDSIVIIVSEETGLISLSMRGELERGFNYETLKARLGEILEVSSQVAEKSASKKSGRRKKDSSGSKSKASKSATNNDTRS